MLCATVNAVNAFQLDEQQDVGVGASLSIPVGVMGLILLSSLRS
jgi:hypothetical protein